MQENTITGRKADVIKAAHLCAEAALRLVKPGNQVHITYHHVDILLSCVLLSVYYYKLYIFYTYILYFLSWTYPLFRILTAKSHFEAGRNPALWHFLVMKS